MACKTTPAPKNLPTALDKYPAGAALATLTQQMANARLVKEDGTVVNMADLLQSIADSLMPGASGQEYDTEKFYDPATDTRVNAVITYDDTGNATYAYFNTDGTEWTGDPATLKLTEPNTVTKDSEPRVMCDSGTTFLRWFEEENGQPTGDHFDTTTTGAAYTVTDEPNVKLGDCASADLWADMLTAMECACEQTTDAADRLQLPADGETPAKSIAELTKELVDKNDLEQSKAYAVYSRGEGLPEKLVAVELRLEDSNAAPVAYLLGSVTPAPAEGLLGYIPDVFVTELLLSYEKADGSCIPVRHIRANTNLPDKPYASFVVDLQGNLIGGKNFNGEDLTTAEAFDPAKLMAECPGATVTHAHVAFGIGEGTPGWLLPVDEWRNSKGEVTGLYYSGTTTTLPPHDGVIYDVGFTSTPAYYPLDTGGYGEVIVEKYFSKSGGEVQVFRVVAAGDPANVIGGQDFNGSEITVATGASEAWMQPYDPDLLVYEKPAPARAVKGDEHITGGAMTPLNVPAGADTASMRNNGTTDSEWTYGTSVWTTLPAGGTLVIDVALAQFKIRAKSPATTQDVTITYTGDA